MRLLASSIGDSNYSGVITCFSNDASLASLKGVKFGWNIYSGDSLAMSSFEEGLDSVRFFGAIEILYS